MSRYNTKEQYDNIKTTINVISLNQVKCDGISWRNRMKSCLHPAQNIRDDFQIILLEGLDEL